MAHIVIDARRIRDFGIGTYIRSLVQALGGIDSTNQYTLVSGPADVRTLAGLPENFHAAVYARDDHSALDHVAFPLFLRGLSPDLVHIPLARVPLLMIRPYRSEFPCCGIRARRPQRAGSRGLPAVSARALAGPGAHSAGTRPAAHDPALRGDRPRHGEHFLRGGHVKLPHALAPFPFRPRVAAGGARDCGERGDPAGLVEPEGRGPEPDHAGVQRARSGVPGGRLRLRHAGAAAHPGALPDRVSVPPVRGQHSPPQEYSAPGGSFRGGARATGGAPGL